jgi:hypothetical protein
LQVGSGASFARAATVVALGKQALLERMSQAEGFNTLAHGLLAQEREVEHNTNSDCGARWKEPNLKHKSQYREHVLGTAVPARFGSKARPNHFIEGTASGLRPPAAPHVER